MIDAVTVVCSGVALAATAATGWWAYERWHRKTRPMPPGYRPEITLPHRREFELYHNALSLCSMKVRVCMAELDIPYESHPIDLIETGAYENIGRRMLAVNPGGTVPVLVHRGHPVYESHLQIRYAAEQAPPSSASLVPDDPALERSMQEWIDRSSLTDDPLHNVDRSAGNAVPGLTLPLFAAMIDRIPYHKILEGLLFHFDKRRPLLFCTLKLLRLHRLDRLTPAMKVLANSRHHMHAHLDALERRLIDSGGPWILGARFTLADVSWLAIFERLVQADLLEVFASPTRRPMCLRYWERLRERPSYRRAILDHAHPTVLRGTTRLRDAKAADPRLRAALEGTPGEELCPPAGLAARR